MRRSFISLDSNAERVALAEARGYLTIVGSALHLRLRLAMSIWQPLRWRYH
jgi:hypothetical protein